MIRVGLHKSLIGTDRVHPIERIRIITRKNYIQIFYTYGNIQNLRLIIPIVIMQ